MKNELLAKKARNWKFDHQQLTPEDLDYCLKEYHGANYKEVEHQGYDIFTDDFYFALEVNALTANGLIYDGPEQYENPAGNRINIMSVFNHKDLKFSDFYIDYISEQECEYEVVRGCFNENIQTCLKKYVFWK